MTYPTTIMAWSGRQMPRKLVGNTRIGNFHSKLFIPNFTMKYAVNMKLNNNNTMRIE